jgi:trigger factor
MQITETLNEGLKRAYEITITGDDLETRVDREAGRGPSEIEMKGFRKGKVPMALLKKQFGPRLMGEAMQEAVDGAMQGHLEETGDRPRCSPRSRWSTRTGKKATMSSSPCPTRNCPKSRSRLQVDQAGAPDRRPADADIDEALATSPRACRTSTPRRAARPPMATRS